MSFLYHIKSEEIEKESDAKKMVRLADAGVDYNTRRVSYSTEELLFYNRILPDKIFLNGMNALVFNQEYIKAKREMEVMEAKAMIAITNDGQHKNETSRRAAQIVYLNNGKTDASKEYIDKRSELDKAYHEKETFTYLLNYHKDVGRGISNHLYQNSTRDKLEKELVNDD